MGKSRKPSFNDMEKFVHGEVERPGGSLPVASLEKRMPGRPKVNQYPTEVKLSILLPKEIHKKLKIKSAEMEKPMAEVVVTAVKEYLKI